MVNIVDLVENGQGQDLADAGHGSEAMEHIGWVDVNLRDHASPQQSGDLESIDPIVLGFAAMDSLHVQGVTKDEGNLLAGSQVGRPVPGEDAFHLQHEIFPVGIDGAEERTRIGPDLSVKEYLVSLVQDAKVHGAGV